MLLRTAGHLARPAFSCTMQKVFLIFLLLTYKEYPCSPPAANKSFGSCDTHFGLLFISFSPLLSALHRLLCLFPLFLLGQHFSSSVCVLNSLISGFPLPLNRHYRSSLTNHLPHLGTWDNIILGGIYTEGHVLHTLTEESTILRKTEEQDYHILNNSSYLAYLKLPSRCGQQYSSRHSVSPPLSQPRLTHRSMSTQQLPVPPTTCQITSTL